MPYIFDVPGTDSSDHSSVYRHPKFVNGTHRGRFVNITTLYELFMDNVARNPDNYFLGTRRCSKEADGFEHYEWISTTDASSIVNQLGAGLQSIFEMYAPEVNPITKQQPLGIFSTNRPEWILAEQAGFRYRKYIVGISDEIDFEQCMLQINEADIRVLVCSIDKIPPIFSRIEKMPNLKVIISMDNFDLCKHTSASMSFNLNDVNGLHAKAKSAGITLFDFKAVLEVGKSSSVPPMPPKPSDYSMLIFKTKTGNCPLGVLHTHESIVHCSRSIYLSMETSIDAVVHLSHLPLAKEFEHSIVYMFMFGTVHIGFGSGSDERLIDDMQFLHPTVLVALPNQLERLHKVLMSKKNLFCNHDYKAVKACGCCTSRRCYRECRIDIQPDKFATDFFNQQLGGRVNLLIYASLLANESTFKFYNSLFGTRVFFFLCLPEFGGGVGFISTVTYHTIIGFKMCPGIDFRLQSNSEMGLKVTDQPNPRGEVMVRAKSMFSGYYKQPEKTSESISEEWFATGYSGYIEKTDDDVYLYTTLK